MKTLPSGKRGARTRAGSTTTVDLVAAILKNYADRAVFRGFSGGPVRAGRAAFKMLWHRDQYFDLILNVPRKTLTFPQVLPNVPAKSEMYREFRKWVDERHSPALLEHRRIDKRKAHLKAGNRAGKASLTMTWKGANFEYATRKLINAVHELYLGFLADGRYYDYMVDTLGLDPDKF